MGAISFSLDERLLTLFTRELPLEVFVETGTFKGETLRMATRHFEECHSVELSADLHRAISPQFATEPGVHLHHGESPAYLRAQSDAFLKRPVFFWLDAHWCVAEGTAGADSQSPLLAELEALGHLHPQSVVAIDDARLYLCPPPAPHRLADWPDFHDIVCALLDLSSTHRLMVMDDVILFYPERLRTALEKHAHEHGADWLKLARDARRWRERKTRPKWWPFG